jgi:hypothetical protein
MTVDEWLAGRREAGLKIDPKTAEVGWIYALTLDPYGVYGELPEELQQVGREHFARAPGTDIWVQFGDLPETACNPLSESYPFANIHHDQCRGGHMPNSVSVNSNRNISPTIPL